MELFSDFSLTSSAVQPALGRRGFAYRHWFRFRSRYSVNKAWTTSPSSALEGNLISANSWYRSACSHFLPNHRTLLHGYLIHWHHQSPSRATPPELGPATPSQPQSAFYVASKPLDWRASLFIGKVRGKSAGDFSRRTTHRDDQKRGGSWRRAQVSC